MKTKWDTLYRLCNSFYSVWTCFLKGLQSSLERITLDNGYIDLMFQPDSRSRVFKDSGLSFAIGCDADASLDCHDCGWQLFLKIAEEYVRREN